MSWREINERIGKVSVLRGPVSWLSVLTNVQVMFSKGMLESPDWKPFPSGVTDPLGDCKCSTKLRAI
jgi:hypothetical protein